MSQLFSGKDSAIIDQKTKGRMLCVRPFVLFISCWITSLGER